MQRRRFIQGVAASSIVGSVVGMPVLANAESKSDTLIINYYNNWQPISYASESSVASGMLIDILDAVLKDRMGLKIRHRGLPWERAQREVQQGKADALCVVRNEARDAYLKFASIPSFELKVVFFFNERVDKATLQAATSMHDLHAFSFGELVGNRWGQDKLKDHPKVAWVADQQSLFEMLSRGRIDIAMVPNVIGRYYQSRLSIKDSIDYCSVPFVQRETRMQLGINRNFPYVDEILKEFDEEMAKLIASGEYDKIVQRYYT
ncbi:substrate-binding periplasmic protein [Curvivirga sp.]|uniref:substrate-binding periplasmic protein n=1 Tax=Curvivirga sp. TaxID=2856848 RepID=UPI003B5C1A23